MQYLSLGKTCNQCRKTKERVTEHLACLSKEAEKKKKVQRIYKLHIGLPCVCRFL